MGNVVAQRSGACFFGDEPTFQRSVLVAAPRRYDFRSKDMKCIGIELSFAIHDRAQDGHAAHVSVVEDLDYLGALVTEAEIGLIEDKRSAESIEGMEDRRNGRGTAREERLVAERSDRGATSSSPSRNRLEDEGKASH